MLVENNFPEPKTSEHQDKLESQITRFGFWFLTNVVDLPQIYRLYSENLRRFDPNQSLFLQSLVSFFSKNTGQRFDESETQKEFQNLFIRALQAIATDDQNLIFYRQILEKNKLPEHLFPLIQEFAEYYYSKYLTKTRGYWENWGNFIYMDSPVTAPKLLSPMLFKDFLDSSQISMRYSQCGKAIVKAVEPILFQWFNQQRHPCDSLPIMYPNALSYSYLVKKEVGVDLEILEIPQDIHNLGIGLSFLDAFVEAARSYLYKDERKPPVRPLLHVYVNTPLENYVTRTTILPADVDGDTNLGTIEFLHIEICRKLSDASGLKEKYHQKLAPLEITVDYSYKIHSLDLNQFYRLLTAYLKKGLIMVPLLDWKKYDPGTQWRFKSPRHAIAILGINQEKPDEWLVFDPAKGKTESIPVNRIYYSLWNGQFSVFGNLPVDESDFNPNDATGVDNNIELVPFDPLADMKKAFLDKFNQLSTDKKELFQSYVPIIDYLEEEVLIKLLSSIYLVDQDLPPLEKSVEKSAIEPAFGQNLEVLQKEGSLLDLYAIASGIDKQKLLEKMRSTRLLYLTTDELYQIAPTLFRTDAGKFWVRELPPLWQIIYTERAYPLYQDQFLAQSNVQHEVNGHFLLGETMPVVIDIQGKKLNLNASVILPVWFREGAANLVAGRYFTYDLSPSHYFTPDSQLTIPPASDIISNNFQRSLYSYLESSVLTAYIMQSLGKAFESKDSPLPDSFNYEMALKGYFYLISLANELARNGIVFSFEDWLKNEKRNNLGYDYLVFIFDRARQYINDKIPSLEEIIKGFDAQKDRYYKEIIDSIEKPT